MDASWMERLKEEFDKPYMKQLEAFLAREYAAGAEVYPPFEQVFNALCCTPFERVKVVIMGQDPYHGMGQAHGLSFSVPDGVAPPPSLKNIFKEISADLSRPVGTGGNLTSWAKQGVLLLNATLTVRSGEPKSHFGQGWEMFTDRIVQLLYEREDPIAFALWGRSALEKVQLQATRSHPHLLLTAPHPSPFSAHSGFFGCRHFSQINQFLEKVGKKPIDWSI